MNEKICAQIALELKVRAAQVLATVALIDEGATIPFIARYRKEVTGGLSDTQLRELSERLIYLRELTDRRQAILNSIREQEKLTPELEAAINAAETKARLEDLYLPYKPKRRTKAQVAIEAGLLPLAEALLNAVNETPEALAHTYLNAEHKIDTVLQALEGARHILMERFSENADLNTSLRELLWKEGLFTSTLIKTKETDAQKFKDYFEYQEPLSKVPSHRALAVFRGQEEGLLRVSVVFALESSEIQCTEAIAKTFSIQSKKRPVDAWLQETVEWTWKIKLSPKLELDCLQRLREAAEATAIDVFKDNLKNLLLAAPAGRRVTMGLDPGLRTGVKVVVVDDTGKLLYHHTIFPHPPKEEWQAALMIIAKLCEHYKVSLISIGNGTASRETEKLVLEVMAKNPALSLTKVVVSEAGASVYSASELAAKEFPDLDVTYRGAVSIARRLQDPLAELVKIDPKAIGVGQYQHDVNQTLLAKGLCAVMEDCVNAVGADVNTASVPLLKSISGLNELTAKKIVAYREKSGAFKTREALKKALALNDKVYEQSIGFLRILEGENPLDASAVHPESYPIIQKMLEKLGKPLKEVMGNEALINTLSPKEFVTDAHGLPTIKDIIEELKKPGRDPRPEFITVQFDESVVKLNDLKSGMLLEGVVTNVTNFGAFVDIGVHQDGLVHISELADKFVSDPHEVVKVGMIVKVRVLELDLERKRVQLSMKSQAKSSIVKTGTQKVPDKIKMNATEKPSNSAFADAFKNALKK